MRRGGDEDTEPLATFDVTFSVVDLPVFKRTIRVLADVYAMSDESTKAFIECEMKQLFGPANVAQTLRA